MRFAIALCVLGACGPKLRYEAAGRGTVVVGAAADVAAPGAGGVVARANVRHDVIVRVRLPHAETVDWQLTCPGATASGTLGETMDAYRTRRIGELRAERDRERRAMANVGAAVGNAVLPPQTVTTTTYTPGASATVATPLGTATVVAPATTTTTTTRVDGATVGAMAGAAVVSDEIVLAPDDVGGGTYTDRATVFPTGDGACVVTVTPAEDPNGIAGEFEVTRVFNIAAEERERREVIVGHANDVRASVRGGLIALGADPELRARVRAEASARAQAEASARAQIEIDARARAQAQIDARVQLEAQVRARAYAARDGMVAWLTYCGGDPYKRQHEREAQLRAQDEARAQAEARDAQLRAQRAAIDEANARRAQIAVEIREQQIALLVSLGGVMRPPMPAPVDEFHGDAVAGQSWVGGHWEWTAPQWIWIPGFWTEVDGGGGGVIETVTTVTDTVGTVTDSVRDHRSTTVDVAVPPPPPPPPPPTNTNVDRDHRSSTPPPPPPPSSGNRDHRTSTPPPSSSSSGNRDHRH